MEDQNHALNNNAAANHPLVCYYEKRPPRERKGVGCF